MQKIGNAKISDLALFVTDHVYAALSYWDNNQVCRFANNAYRTILGKSRDEIIGMSMDKLLGPEYAKTLGFIEGVLQGEEQRFEGEFEFADGSVRSYLATYSPHIVEHTVIGFISHITDITELKVLEAALREEKEKAEKLATHDFLTGLPNRVLLMDRISIAINRAERHRHSVAVMSVDLDNFKAVNDTHGHDIGDQLLKEVAAKLKNVLRTTDTATRMGGDEFILLSSDIQSMKDAQRIASRVLHTVHSPFECLRNSFIKPTFSIGIAVYPYDGKEAEELLRCSDRALYKAKERGRNRFECFSEYTMKAF